MRPHKAIQFYFECMVDLGEDMNFSVTKYKSSGEEVVTYNHLTHDGVTAMVEHLETLPGKKTFPVMGWEPPPGLFMRLVFLTRWWYSVAYRRFYVPKGTKNEGALFGFRRLQINTEKNLNARILWALHQAMGTKKTTLWMLPVSLHKEIKPGMPGENNVSFIDVKIHRTDDMQTVKYKIGKELKLKSYWGTIYSMWVPKILGKKLFIKAFPYFTLFLRRTGTFTNMGKWELEAAEKGEHWAARLTVIPLNPLGASALQINDQLTIGLQIHPFLGLGKVELDQILDRWQAALQSQLPS